MNDAPKSQDVHQAAALRGEPEAAGQDCHGLDTPERVRFYEHDFYVLSNFSAFNVSWGGFRFQTSEHLYHYMKFARPWSDEARREPIDFSGPEILVAQAIFGAPSAHEAFKIAEQNRELRRPDWDQVKVSIMRDILRAKAMQHSYVLRKLFATGDRELVEDSWRDDFWGWGPNRDGQNMLGKLWMQVRAELRGTEPPQAASGSQESARSDVLSIDVVEQRLLTWRQRFMNKSGDRLALDDFMGQESIDDLIDFVCAPPAQSAEQGATPPAPAAPGGPAGARRPDENSPSGPSDRALNPQPEAVDHDRGAPNAGLLQRD
ncbi:NADAR family protein [Methylibium sp.]|uniref:NADAR family protein n=1 Tax=Methylibium sp. TaxID=2067992 RepID=UPI003BAD5BDC